jgi:hypothetical protein
MCIHRESGSESSSQEPRPGRAMNTGPPAGPAGDGLLLTFKSTYKFKLLR